jgi:hypothetical protein
MAIGQHQALELEQLELQRRLVGLGIQGPEFAL